MKRVFSFLIFLVFFLSFFLVFAPRESYAQQIPPCPPTGKTGGCMAPSSCTSGNSFATQACSVDGSRVCCITGDSGSSGGSGSDYKWGGWGKPAGSSLTNFSNLLGSNRPENASRASWQNVLSTIISLLILAAVVLSLAYLILGGFNYLSSGGDKQKLTQARHYVVYAFIGLLVVFVSFLIIQFMGSFFGVNFLVIP